MAVYFTSFCFILIEGCEARSGPLEEFLGQNDPKSRFRVCKERVLEKEEIVWLVLCLRPPRAVVRRDG